METKDESGRACRHDGGCRPGTSGVRGATRFVNKRALKKQIARRPRCRRAYASSVFSCAQRPKSSPYPGNRVMIHLRAPLRVYCLCQAKNTQIERKVGYINKLAIATKGRTGREEQSTRRAGARET